MTKMISWQEHLDRCAASGQSKREYCEQHNLSYKSFFYHQRKLATLNGAFEEVPVSFIENVTQIEYHFLDGTHLSFPALILRSVLDVVRTR